MERTPKNPEEVLLIVHGVGDPVQGETLDHFARSLVNDHEAMLEKRERLWLQEHVPQSERPTNRFAKTFSSHVRHFESRNHSATAAEIFWGDLSQVRRGILGILAGLMQIIFGLRYVAYVAADQPGWAARGLRLLALHCSRLLHGPLLAVNILLAVLTLLLVGTQALWPDSYLSGMWADSLAIMTSISLMLLAGLLWRIARSRVVERVWFWIFVGSFFLGILVGIKTLIAPEVSHLHDHDHHNEMGCGLFWYCRIFFILLEFQYIWLTFMMVAMAICWGCAILHPKTHRQGLHVGFLIPMLLIGLWSLIIPMFWVTAGEALKKVVDVDRYDWLFHEAVPMLAIQCVMSVMLAVMMVIVLIWYAVWRSRNHVENYEIGRRSPRLILNPLVQFCVGLAAIVGIGMSLWMAYLQLDGTPYEKYAIGSILVEANKYAIAVLVPLTGLLVFSLQYLRSGLDIVLDVVNHFYLRPIVDHDEHDVLHDDDEYLGRFVTESHEVEFTRRDIIGSRMRKVLEHFGQRFDNRPILNIVAHSQGTIIAAEILNSDDMNWLRTKFKKINLITMGSPLGHLYQYYFPHIYPALDQPFWSNLRSRVDRWMNIFRIDDFVGTEISFPNSIRESKGPVCSNHPIEVAGHNWYWIDREALSVIAGEQISPIVSESFHDANDGTDRTDVLDHNQAA